MKNTILTFIVIATAIFLNSCEKEIEFKGEQTDSRLVINSVVEPGQSVKARISKSVFFLDNNENTKVPSDLVATLYVNGNRIGEMTPQTDTIWETEYNWVFEPTYRLWKIYTYPYCPAVGDEVTIKALANGFDDVEGSTGIVPNHTNCQIKGLRLMSNELWPNALDDDGNIIDWHYYDAYELLIELTDPHAGEIDFFKLSMDESYHYFEGYDHYNYYCHAYITGYDDPIFGAVSATNFDFVDYQINDPNGTFTDQLFDGRSYTIKQPIGISYSQFEGLEQNFCRVAVYVEHITKDYYKYLNTCNQGDEVDQFFAEPIQTHTNVNGGYGIIGGRTVDTLWLELPIIR